MKVWTVSNRKGWVTGVYFDQKLAEKNKDLTDTIEEWEPELTYDACEAIKNLAQELT